jgi:hypothetical protein
MGARKLAENNGVDLRYYNIIYDAVDELKAAMSGMLAPEQREEIIGSAEIRTVFVAIQDRHDRGLYGHLGPGHVAPPASACCATTWWSTPASSSRSSASKTTCAKSRKASSAVSSSRTTTTSKKVISWSSSKSRKWRGRCNGSPAHRHAVQEVFTPNRGFRVADQIQRDLAELIARELKDPRVGMVTINAVEVTPDYAHAKVYFRC